MASLKRIDRLIKLYETQVPLDLNDTLVSSQLDNEIIKMSKKDLKRLLKYYINLCESQLNLSTNSHIQIRYADKNLKELIIFYEKNKQLVNGNNTIESAYDIIGENNQVKKILSHCCDSGLVSVTSSDENLAIIPFDNIRDIQKPNPVNQPINLCSSTPKTPFRKIKVIQKMAKDTTDIKEATRIIPRPKCKVITTFSSKFSFKFTSKLYTYIENGEIENWILKEFDEQLDYVRFVTSIQIINV